MRLRAFLRRNIRLTAESVGVDAIVEPNLNIGTDLHFLCGR